MHWCIGAFRLLALGIGIAVVRTTTLEENFGSTVELGKILVRWVI